METITLIGLILVGTGCYYSWCDVLQDLGIRKQHSERTRSIHNSTILITSQMRVEKMARMHV